VIGTWRRPLVGERRDRASRYLLVTIVAFAVTVMATRVYLDMAGYPKVGGGGLHVAHLLWGGLLLVVAVLLVQLFVGRRALLLSALAAGVGVGLFIDEVGKFLTETNDYFFAPAAPIIYGTVLLLVLLWLRVRHERAPTREEAVQGAIEAVRDLADGRLSAPDRERAIERLRASGTFGDGGIADHLAGILASSEAETRLAAPGWFERGEARRWVHRLLPDRLERVIVRIGLLLSALSALGGLLVALVVEGGGITAIPQPNGPIELPEDPVWLLLLAFVWIVVGVANGVALVLSLAGRHERAMGLAQYAVLFGLVAGGLLNTYVSQVGALANVLVQLGLLLLILDQRSRLAGARREAIPGDPGPATG
jgi:hypothetical protein